MPEPPALTIVIPAHDAASTLPHCLAAADGVSGCEVVVVDDASTDRTAAIAETAGARVIHLAKQSGPAAARNAGVAVANSEIVLFLDSDVKMHRDVAEKVLNCFREHPALAAVFGSYDDAPAASGFVSQYKNLMHHYVHQTSSEDAKTFWCGCGAIRKDIFLNAGGLDAQRYPRPQIEDVELGTRLVSQGHRILLDKSIQVTHLKKWTLTGLLRSDILDRALPWTELLHSGVTGLGDLNLKIVHRISALLAFGVIAAFLAGFFLPWIWLVGVAVLAVFLLLNGDLYLFYYRKRGLFFALRSMPMHFFYYLYSTVGYAWGTVRWLIKRNRQH